MRNNEALKKQISNLNEKIFECKLFILIILIKKLKVQQSLHKINLEKQDGLENLENIDIEKNFMSQQVEELKEQNLYLTQENVKKKFILFFN